ncbi:kinase-like protein [Hypoxylon sp. FL1150]|nr:kinase-like protein [Hypoxylon sp. FL1150]
MGARLRKPLISLSMDNFLSRGSGGQVFIVSRTIVFKGPTLFDDPAPRQAEEMEESIKRIENEKSVYRVLMDHRHPNIVDCLRCIPQGIFLNRLVSTLEHRINISHSLAILPSVQERWVQQLTSALAWIENLGYVHGDLRPANIFLDANEDIRLGDFDAAVKKNEQLFVASEPFCKLNEDYELPIAGPVSEQFSLGSCIYTIRFGYPPWHDVDAPIRVRRLMQNQFPSTSTDHLLGQVTDNCWHGVYESMIAVERDVQTCLGIQSNMGQSKKVQVDEKKIAMLQAECDEFIRAANQNPKDSLRCHNL